MKKNNGKQLSVVAVNKSNDSKSQSPLIKGQKQIKNQSKLSVNNTEVGKKQKLREDQKVWGEMRVEGKMILSRSNHISVVHQDYLYVHGGKNNYTNAFNDLYRLYLKGEEKKELQQWELVDSVGPGLKRHCGILYQDQIIMIGGLDQKDQQNSHIYSYHIGQKQWTQLDQNTHMDGIDSQSVVLVDQQIIVFGGFKQTEGKYQNRIDSYDIQTKEWSNLFQESDDAYKNSKIPMPRSNCSLVDYQNKLYILGGMNGNKKCDDFWEFDLQTRQFREMHNENTPQIPSGRSGHRCIVHDDQIIMFGGIQQITQEKNDLHVYDLKQNQWKQLQMDDTQNDEDDKLSIYNTDNPKMSEQNTKQVKQTKRQFFSYLNYNQPSQKFLNSSQRKHQDFMQSSRGERTFNAIEMQKDRERLQSKQNLLSLFEVDDKLKEELRVKTPHTEAMRSTLMTIKHTNNLKISNLILEQDEKRWNEVESFNKIPCPRDGHSVCLVANRMIVFGGDRHKMSFNDLYILELDNIKQIIK